MSNVWFCIPSARPLGGTVPKWKEKGYRLALWRDRIDSVPALGSDDIVITAPYPGYSKSVNALMKAAFAADPECVWAVTGGDDTLPDPRSPELIARECGEYFNGTFGVMQPTGDPWANYSIEKICGSPWVGRAFWQRTYSGEGPFWPEYWHNFNDDELQDVSKKLGALWQRRDLTHHHEHWMRQDNGVRRNVTAPDFLKRASSMGMMNAMRTLYHARKKAGFPGALPA